MGSRRNSPSQLNAILQEIGEPVLFGSPAVTVVNGKPRMQNRAYLVDDKGKLWGGMPSSISSRSENMFRSRSSSFFVNHLVEAAGDFVPGRDSTPVTLMANGSGC